eukprot:Skav217577  [mRNA]  locus=scaffold129:176486:180644:- [translate_table: standard]
MGSGASKRDVGPTGIKDVHLNHAVTKKYMALSQHGKVQAEYVWIDSDYWDGHSFDLCCKTLTLPDVPISLDDIPIWTYSGDDAKDIVIVPRRTYRDPFRGGDNVIVLADTYEDSADVERRILKFSQWEFQVGPASGTCHGIDQ